jgi:hypothetical protein
MQVPVTRPVAERYVANRTVPGGFEPTRTWGLCSRMVDVARAESGTEARAQHGLAEDTADFPPGDGLFVLRFPASWPGLFQASFGGQTTAGAARLDSTLVLPDPFLGTGYTKYAPAAVPEYWMELAELPIGAELWYLAEERREDHAQGIARYTGRHSGWHAFPAAGELGLSPAAPAPAPAGTVVRGLLVTVRGAQYPADFGPEPGTFTAYRTADDGTVMSRQLSEADCEAIEYRRLLATWRDTDFELLAMDPLTDTAEDGPATLAHITGNAEQAAALGLTATARHAWRARPPKSELTQFAEETRKIGPQPHFGDAAHNAPQG